MASRFRSNIRLSDACDRYVDRIRTEGQAAASIHMTEFALAALRRGAGTKGNLDPYVHLITPADMDAYCYGPAGLRAESTRTGKPLRATTFNRYRSSLRTFFEYAVMMHWTDINPMKGITAARPDAPRARLLLSATELLSVLEHCKNPIERIGCSIAMNTALRGGDVTRLTVFDANLTGGVLQSEIRKTRQIDNKPITMDLHFELTKWLNEYADIMGLDGMSNLQDDWFLVPSYKAAAPRETDRRVKIRPVRQLTNPWRLVQRPLERMGYPTEHEGMHTLRRSSARVLFESLRTAGEGHDHALLVVSEFLNHANVTMTQRYLGLNHERDIRDNLLKGRPFLTAQAAKEHARIAQATTQVAVGGGTA